MKLQKIAGIDCDDIRTCPAIYTTDRGTVIVQGNKVDGEARSLMSIPGHEDAVELTPDLIIAAYHQLNGGA
jgi:hypothetical protein